MRQEPKVSTVIAFIAILAFLMAAVLLAYSEVRYADAQDQVEELQTELMKVNYELHRERVNTYLLIKELDK